MFVGFGMIEKSKVRAEGLRWEAVGKIQERGGSARDFMQVDAPF